MADIQRQTQAEEDSCRRNDIDSQTDNAYRKRQNRQRQDGRQTKIDCQADSDTDKQTDTHRQTVAGHP